MRFKEGFLYWELPLKFWHHNNKGLGSLMLPVVVDGFPLCSFWSPLEAKFNRYEVLERK